MEQCTLLWNFKILNSHLTSHTNINSECITDLNVKHKTKKLPEENLREKLCDLELGKDFLDTTPKPKRKNDELIEH